MFQSTHEKLFLLIDELEEDAVLITSSFGYRLASRIYRSYLYNKNSLEQKTKDYYVNYSNRQIIEREKKKREDPLKQDSFKKNLSPRFSGNLAFDIIISIFWVLSGTKKRYAKIDEIIKILSKGWVFLD